MRVPGPCLYSVAPSGHGVPWRPRCAIFARLRSLRENYAAIARRAQFIIHNWILYRSRVYLGR